MLWTNVDNIQSIYSPNQTSSYNVTNTNITSFGSDWRKDELINSTNSSITNITSNNRKNDRTNPEIQTDMLTFGNTLESNMVLQQSPQKAKIWGNSTSGSIVVVKLLMESNGKVIHIIDTITESNGLWSVYLKPIMASNSIYTIIATSGTITISMNNILFGDVFFCAGQSNMQLTMDQIFNSTAEIQDANNYPMIRLFTASRTTDWITTPQVELIKIWQTWSVASNSTVFGGRWEYFSALCWFFGRNIHKYRKYPIGLIVTAHMNTPIRWWVSPYVLDKCEAGNRIENKYDSTLWNSQIYPFLQTTIRGVIWFQGETDKYHLNDAIKYGCRFSSMISNWRYKWSSNSNTSSNFPFGFVHLSTFEIETGNKTCGNDINCQLLAIIRWSQSAQFGYVPNRLMPNTFMATAVDLGDYKSPYGQAHSRFKQQVAERLTNAAKNIIYGDTSIYWQGPIINKAFIFGNNTIIISFRNVGTKGLIIKNSYGFEVYDNSKGKWITTIDPINVKGNDSILLIMPPNITNINNVSQIRYGWMQAPCLPSKGLYNCAIYDSQHKLPAIPFLINVTI